MNKNFKIITINGIRGIFAAVFIVLGLIAGFIISPGWVCMHIWNYIAEQAVNMVTMNIFQGIMLWAIIALSLYALNNKKALIGFGAYQALSPDQIKDIMKRTNVSEERVRQEIEALNKKYNLHPVNDPINDTKPDNTDNEKQEEKKDDDLRSQL